MMGVGDGYIGVNLGRRRDIERGTDGVCGFFASGYDGSQLGKLRDESGNIRWFYHFEEFVGSVIFKSTDG